MIYPPTVPPRPEERFDVLRDLLYLVVYSTRVWRLYARACAGTDIVFSCSSVSSRSFAVFPIVRRRVCTWLRGCSDGLHTSVKYCVFASGGKSPVPRRTPLGAMVAPVWRSLVAVATT